MTRLTFWLTTSIFTLTPLLAQAQAPARTNPTLDLSENFTCPDNQARVEAGELECVLDDNLELLIADFEANALINNPFSAGEKGDRQALRQLPDVSLTAQRNAQSRLDALDRRHTALQRSADFARLSPNDRLTYQMMGFMLDQSRRLQPFDESRIPFTNDSGFFNAMSYVSRQTRFEQYDDFEAYAARLTQLPRYFSQHQENMQRGVEENFTASADILPGIIDMVRRLSEGPAAEHPLYAPFKPPPDTLNEEQKASLKALGLAVINTSVLPAYRDLLRFLEEDYMPAARPVVGIGSTEEGRDPELHHAQHDA